MYIITGCKRKICISNMWGVDRKIRRHLWNYPYTFASAEKSVEAEKMFAHVLHYPYFHDISSFDYRLHLILDNHLPNRQFSSRETMATELHNFFNSKDCVFCEMEFISFISVGERSLHVSVVILINKLYTFS